MSFPGSLVATTSTGKGVSAIDFLCLNQREETVSAVLGFVKEQNYKAVETFMIDKDFVE